MPPHTIRIEINKEEQVVDYLTKDHKANMSLLFYDFNNANQRRLYHNTKQNLADVVIPEEAGEEPGLKVQDEDLMLLSRQEMFLKEIIQSHHRKNGSTMTMAAPANA